MSLKIVQRSDISFTVLHVLIISVVGECS